MNLPPRDTTPRRGASDMPVGTAAVGLLGAAAGLGLVLLVTGLARTQLPAWPRWQHLAQRARAAGRAQSRRAAAAALAAAVTAVATRWPVVTLLAAATAWWLPQVTGRG